MKSCILIIKKKPAQCCCSRYFYIFVEENALPILNYRKTSIYKNVRLKKEKKMLVVVKKSLYTIFLKLPIYIKICKCILFC